MTTNGITLETTKTFKGQARLQTFLNEQEKTMNKPWKENDRVYSEKKDSFATVRNTDKYKNGTGIIELETDGGMIGTGKQRAFEGEWKLVEENW
jgi:hypothetical protein